MFVLYRDIRTYGLLEDYYTQARDMGVIFMRYDRERPPVVEPTPEAMMVRVEDEVIKR